MLKAGAASLAAIVVAIAATAATGDPAPLEVEVVERRPSRDASRDAAAGLDRYTVRWARRQLPLEPTGRTARRVPGQALPFLPQSNLIEMEPLWKKAGHDDWIVIGRGHYTLASLTEQLDDPDALRREANGAYLLSRPVYVAPTGSLSVTKGEWLRMSSRDGAILVSNGRVLIADARVTAWDPSSRRIPRRSGMDKTSARLGSKSELRPYLLFQNGSETWIANSELTGLGYMGEYGSYGLSFSATLGERSLNRHMQKLPRPRGWLIGNRIEDFLFGVYSNRTRELVIVGNDFNENVIYGIDPHDHSRRVIIARNLARNTEHSHGIIVSRDVSDVRIVGNISVRNAGSGIVLDRQSRRGIVENNISIANSGDGIALFESGSARVVSNKVLMNQRNGIFSRNSMDVVMEGNHVTKNGDDGIEVMAQSLKEGSRNLRLDPYEAKSSARLESNFFEDNANNAVSAKSVSMLSMSANLYVDSGPSYFGGDLNKISATILRQEPKEPSAELLIREPGSKSR